MRLKIHDSDYDESEGLIVINERRGHELIEETSQMIIRLFPDELKTTQYGEFDVIDDFSFLDDFDIKTVMKES